MAKTQLQRNLDKLAYIPAGSIVDVEIITPIDSKRVKTEFIGLLNEQHIILNYPSARRLINSGELIKEGVMVIVRAVLESGGGQVIAFRQQIKAVASHPYRLRPRVSTYKESLNVWMLVAPAYGLRQLITRSMIVMEM